VLDVAERIASVKGWFFVSAGVSSLACGGFVLVLECDVPQVNAPHLGRIVREYEAASLAGCAALVLTELRQ
jgi:GTP:adenosylcobinamide-phosphate guanylyltransferase